MFGGLNSNTKISQQLTRFLQHITLNVSWNVGRGGGNTGMENVTKMSLWFSLPLPLEITSPSKKMTGLWNRNRYSQYLLVISCCEARRECKPYSWVSSSSSMMAWKGESVWKKTENNALTTKSTHLVREGRPWPWPSCPSASPLWPPSGVTPEWRCWNGGCQRKIGHRSQDKQEKEGPEGEVHIAIFNINER